MFSTEQQESCTILCVAVMCQPVRAGLKIGSVSVLLFHQTRGDSGRGAFVIPEGPDHHSLGYSVLLPCS